MARRRLPWTRPRNWAGALLTGRYVVASAAVRAAYGLTDTDNSDTQDIVGHVGLARRRVARRGGALMAWGRTHTAAQKPAWNQDDYHTEFAGKLKEQIEQGVAPWQKPWQPGEERLPKNIQTDKRYRGGNSVYLSVTQTAKGYSDNRWATYKQIKDMGGQVRKGEKATHVLFYKFDDETQKAQDQPDRPTTEGKAEREHTRPPMVRCYAVFNVAQADGLQLERKGDDREHEPEWKAHQTAERVIQESGIHVSHVRGDRAFYNLQSDTVTLPEREQFATANGYYQTALHELGHATGHPERMDRDTLKHGAGHFGSVEYAPRRTPRGNVRDDDRRAMRRRPRRQPRRGVRQGLVEGAGTRPEGDVQGGRGRTENLRLPHASHQRTGADDRERAWGAGREILGRAQPADSARPHRRHSTPTGGRPASAARRSPCLTVPIFSGETTTRRRPPRRRGDDHVKDAQARQVTARSGAPGHTRATADEPARDGEDRPQEPAGHDFTGFEQEPAGPRGASRVDPAAARQPRGAPSPARLHPRGTRARVGAPG